MRSAVTTTEYVKLGWNDTPGQPLVLITDRLTGWAFMVEWATSTPRTIFLYHTTCTSRIAALRSRAQLVGRYRPVSRDCERAYMMKYALSVFSDCLPSRSLYSVCCLPLRTCVLRVLSGVLTQAGLGWLAYTMQCLYGLAKWDHFQVHPPSLHCTTASVSPCLLEHPCQQLFSIILH